MKITTFFQAKNAGGTGAGEGTGREKRKSNDSNSQNDDPNKRQRIDDVEDILRYLTDNSQDGWKAAIFKYTCTPAFARLATFVSNERKMHTVYPEPQNTWSALNSCPIDKVKVVIVGQDPYQ
jgi:hypothetical protein